MTIVRGVTTGYANAPGWASRTAGPRREIDVAGFPMRSVFRVAPDSIELSSTYPRTGPHGRSAYRIVWTSCSIVGESSVSDSRIIKLISSSERCTIRTSVRSPKI